ncbi:hypothetical protein M5K25_021766 [Dendrobium thyrsiflorum]|uniref:Uncharacterized protein n=1 Tax=Dendrobium thyrsiflorum TaxID=117978 RepID=A0ABD0UAN8_DENTH
MASAKLLLLIFFFLFIQIHAAQPRFLHGLFSENPMAFPPSAYQFFNLYSTPPAAQVAPTPQGLVRGSADSAAPLRVRANGEKVLLFGLIAVIVFAMVVFYLRARRRANARLVQLPCNGLTYQKEGERIPVRRLKVVGGRAQLGTFHPGFESPLLRSRLFSGAKQVWARSGGWPYFRRGISYADKRSLWSGSG